MKKDDLIGSKEGADILGCNKQMFHYFWTTRSDFPKPIVELAQGPVWNRKEVERWKEENRRIA